MELLEQPIVQPSYAESVNSQFYKSKSQYVSLRQRLVDTLNTKHRKQVVTASIEEFLNRNPQFSTWDDFTFCRCEKTTLDKIVIDITLQRMLDIMHACRIMDKFQQIRVMPISVYEDPLAPGKFVC